MVQTVKSTSSFRYFSKMLDFSLITLICASICSLALAGELTFELPDNEKQCFYEEVDKDVKCTIEFQVVTGGNYDVDMELTSPTGEVLYKDVKKQYDSYTWTTSLKGVYKFCFSNEFSSFTHKVVYLDFQAGEDKRLPGIDAAQPTAMTMMETASVTIHEAMKVVLDYQTHHKLREATGRAFAEDLNQRVMLLSVIVSVVILLSSIGQVLTLRSFFSEKKVHNVSTKT